MITIRLSRQLDDHELSDCVVLYHALDTFRHSLKQAENEGLCYPAYFQQAYQIIDDLSHELTEALLGINQPKQEVNGVPVGLLFSVNSWQGGSQLGTNDYEPRP